jgi:RNA polymerase sigma factor (sigma-70 family)
LVALVRQGWPAAFEAVYNRHQRGILSFCRHVLSDPDEAEDAVQHTFLAAYNDLIASDKPIHLRAWLFTIARNRCYSILRARREQPAADLDEPVTEGLATQVQRRQDLRDLVVDLRSLPDEQRAALVLAELDALSHEEIGEALGVPREKVKALVFQARESLVASRTARETACADIREQLSNGRGGALRRANLRRHLRDCSGCRDFRRQVERQRRQIAALLPVVPTLGLKETVLAGTGSAGAGSAGAGFGGAGLLASSALKSGVLKGLATLMLATAGTAGTYVATHSFHANANAGTAVRPHPQAVSTGDLAATAHRAAILAPAVGRAAANGASDRRGRDAGLTPRATTHARAGDGVLNPFGRLGHGRSTFPRQTGSRLHSIAPPASTGKARTPATGTPVAASSGPSATISSTSPPSHVGDVGPKPVTDKPTPVTDKPKPVTDKPKPVSDRSSATGDTRTVSRVSAGSAHGVGSSGGTHRPRPGTGRVRRGRGGRGHGSSGRLPGQVRHPPAGNPPASSGSKLPPASGTPRGVPSRDGPGTTTGVTAGSAGSSGKPPTTTTTEPGSTSTPGTGGSPSAGTGRTGIGAVSLSGIPAVGVGL